MLTRRAPAWLTVEGTPPRFVVIPERAAVVRRIFEETVAGLGKHHIAKNLNRDGVPTFGRAAGWHSSYIQKILTSPAVLGEFQPGQKPRGEARRKVGDVLADYYPRIIDADVQRILDKLRGKGVRDAFELHMQGYGCSSIKGESISSTPPGSRRSAAVRSRSGNPRRGSGPSRRS